MQTGNSNHNTKTKNNNYQRAGRIGAERETPNVKCRGGSPEPAMTHTGNNAPSAQPQLERDKTVTRNGGSPQRTWGGESPMRHARVVRDIPKGLILSDPVLGWGRAANTSRITRYSKTDTMRRGMRLAVYMCF